MKTLAITVYRQDPYLPLWLTYYSHFFDDLLVLNDNLPTDNSKELLDMRQCLDFRIEDIRTQDDRPKFIWLTSLTTELLKFYFHNYDVIMFSGCDEFIVPLNGNLREYMENMKTDFARCTGYDVIQQKGELDLKFNEPILPQRTMWAPYPEFNKPLITKIPLTYEEGWHCLKGEQLGKPLGDPNLALIHLKRADFAIHKKRYDNFQFKNHEQDFEQYMLHQNDSKVVPIPPEWRSRF